MIRGCLMVLLLLVSLTIDAAANVELKQAVISGHMIKVGQGADIVQSRITARKYITGSYGQESKGYYSDKGKTYIITYGPPAADADSIYVVKKIEQVKK